MASFWARFPTFSTPFFTFFTQEPPNSLIKTRKIWKNSPSSKTLCFINWKELSISWTHWPQWIVDHTNCRLVNEQEWLKCSTIVHKVGSRKIAMLTTSQNCYSPTLLLALQQNCHSHLPSQNWNAHHAREIETFTTLANWNGYECPPGCPHGLDLTK
jgi:hypothetical protein